MLTVDLAITGALLVDIRGEPIAAPVHGEQTFVQADWITTGLSESEHYVVHFEMDGVLLESANIEGQTGQRLSHTWEQGGWYAAPGSHAVTVTIDGMDDIPEDNEANNTLSFSFATLEPTSLLETFVLPIAGEQSIDWAVLNYVDIDPTSNYSDYRGGGATYNGHRGIDYGLAHFAQMDEGVEVFAAASGIVSETTDGYFDRNSDWVTPETNYVILDHGNGWKTFYRHLRRDSVAVIPGQSVVAGQPLGLVGSSGPSSGPHLHFHVEHRGALVATYLAPGDYWDDPLPYTFDAPTGLLDCGITNEWPDNAEMREHPSDIDGVPAIWQRIWPWAQVASLRHGDTYGVRLYRPDGTLFVDYPEAGFNWSGSLRFLVTLPTSPEAGQWRVGWYVNNAVLAERELAVGEPTPEIRLYEDTTYIIDGRTTPIDFGVAPFGGLPTIKVFRVDNHGDAVLNVSNIQVPDGFSLVGARPLVVAPHSEEVFSVRLDTTKRGVRSGSVVLLTNDASESVFDFRVEGIVLPSADFDADGNVDDDDFLIWQVGFGIQLGATNREGDADLDGDVDGDDFLIWQANFDSSATTGSTSAALATNGSRPSRLECVKLRNKAVDESLAELDQFPTRWMKTLVREEMIDELTQFK